MAKNNAPRSIKHEAIDRDNTRIVASVSGAVFVVVFCAFAMKTLFSQSLYHQRVISEKEKTLKQLETNIDSLQTLKASFDAFVNEPKNILTGSPAGGGAIDGDNAKIVLDALPGKYDFPALSTSFEKILIGGGYKVTSIGGSEDQGAPSGSTADVQPQAVPFTFTVSASLDKTVELIQTLERSIRPMYVDRLGVSVNADGTLQTSFTLHTYYTLQKSYELGSKEVK